MFLSKKYWFATFVTILLSIALLLRSRPRNGVSSSHLAPKVIPFSGVDAPWKVKRDSESVTTSSGDDVGEVFVGNGHAPLRYLDYLTSLAPKLTEGDKRRKKKSKNKLSEHNTADTLWVFFYGDSIMRNTFNELLFDLAPHVFHEESPSTDSLRDNHDERLVLLLPDEDCMKREYVRWAKKEKCVHWEYVIHLPAGEYTAPSAVRGNPPLLLHRAHNIRLSYHAKHSMYDEEVDHDVLSQAVHRVKGSDAKADAAPIDIVPNLMLVNSGLWDELTARLSPEQYGDEILPFLRAVYAHHRTPSAVATGTSIQTAVAATTSPSSPSSANSPLPRLVWLGTSAMVEDLLPEWKKPFMSNTLTAQYNRVFRSVLTSACEGPVRWPSSSHPSTPSSLAPFSSDVFRRCLHGALKHGTRRLDLMGAGESPPIDSILLLNTYDVTATIPDLCIGDGIHYSREFSQHLIRSILQRVCGREA